MNFKFLKFAYQEVNVSVWMKLSEVCYLTGIHLFSPMPEKHICFKNLIDPDFTLPKELINLKFPVV
jgi:hypothetical protein